MEFHITTPTLIPEASTYGVAILVVMSLGSTALAADIRARWFVGTAVKLHHTYGAILTMAIAWSVLVVDWRPLLGSSLLAWGISIPAGIGAGIIASWCDRAILRAIKHRSITHRSHTDKARSSTRVEGRFRARSIRPRSLAGNSRRVSRRQLGVHRLGERLERAFEYRRERPAPFLIIGALEELVYRGCLVAVCLLLPHTVMIVLALAGTLIAFALTHIWFGWPHVAAKFPLGAITMATVLLIGSVLPAVIAHLLFNFNVWKDTRDTFPVPNAPRQLTTAD